MLIMDPNAHCRFVLVDGPSPVTDYTTKAPVMGTDGKPLYRYTVLVIREQGRPTQIAVKAPGTTQAVDPGTRVSFQGLTGTLWERDGKQAVAFRASAIAPAVTGGK